MHNPSIPAATPALGYPRYYQQIYSPPHRLWQALRVLHPGLCHIITLTREDQAFSVCITRVVDTRHIAQMEASALYTPCHADVFDMLLAESNLLWDDCYMKHWVEDDTF